MRDYWRKETRGLRNNNPVSVVGFLDEGLLVDFFPACRAASSKFQWLDF
ncbi:TPA: hypothetical protein I9Y63_003109 [Legionella pneumophila]|nr:hypothetical protein [Legionella pneumophila]